MKRLSNSIITSNVSLSNKLIIFRITNIKYSYGLCFFKWIHNNYKYACLHIGNIYFAYFLPEGFPARTLLDLYSLSIWSLFDLQRNRMRRLESERRCPSSKTVLVVRFKCHLTTMPLPKQINSYLTSLSPRSVDPLRDTWFIVVFNDKKVYHHHCINVLIISRSIYFHEIHGG